MSFKGSLQAFAPFAVAIALAATACGDTSAEGDGEAAVGEEDLTETPRALSEDQKRELADVGFSQEEIKSVAESVAISKLLGVQSFVAEANDGHARSDASIRRESHGKHQGCLRAKFDVVKPGPGVFTAGASYPAWVRLSNGGAYQRNDGGQHISRGWGIKLLGAKDTPRGVQDFLFITSPRFFINDINHYPGVLKASGNGRVGFFVNLLFNMSLEEKAVIIHRLGLKVSNLLESPEYSAVPYAYGNETVKYALAQCGSQPPFTPESRPPSSDSPDYLEEAMNASLAASDPAKGVCYDFFVQRPRGGGADSVDNPTRAWEGAFDRVATITIPKGQERGGPSDYRENDDECERMAFDPFNATAASQPRGKTNWTRKFVYAALSHFRRIEMPELYARWQKNHDDASVPVEYRKELKKLKDPNALAPIPRETHEPGIDEGFKRLGIVD